MWNLIRTHPRSSVIAAGAVIVLVVAVVLASLPSRDEDERSARCEHVSQLNTARNDSQPVSVGIGIDTVVLGDSYAQGEGMGSPRQQSWPTQYGRLTNRTVRVDSIGGTGFVNGGFCGGQQLGTRVDAALTTKPQLVIVQAGLNDAWAPAPLLREAVDGLLVRLRDVQDVLVVGPVAVPAFPRAKVESVDAVMMRTASKNGRSYISALNWRFPMLSDRIHLSPDGQVEYARQLAAADVSRPRRSAVRSN